MDRTRRVAAVDEAEARDGALSSLDLQQQALAVVWCQPWPLNLDGQAVRICDFTGAKSFERLAGGMGYESVTHWRAAGKRTAAGAASVAQRWGCASAR